MQKESILKEKALAFAIRIVKLYKYLSETKNEIVLSKQVLRSGTAIGAMIHEAQFAESKANFIHKLHIALKEANETSYWFVLLEKGEYISTIDYESIKEDLDHLLKMLISSINTLKINK